jgi:hypothetical protein
MNTDIHGSGEIQLDAPSILVGEVYDLDIEATVIGFK